MNFLRTQQMGEIHFLFCFCSGLRVVKPTEAKVCKLPLAKVHKICNYQLTSVRVTGAMVAHRTLNPLVLGSSPRLPIL
jgi:hypothetical protein